MKTENHIFIAFLLNLFFSILEFFGGIITGSVAIVSDAVHDLGDAAGIGAAFFLEKKSKKGPDETHTYGYGRYSVLGGAITNAVLICSSLIVTYHAVLRILHPSAVRYNGMIFFAFIGVGVNLAAALFTRKGNSTNQKAVNLHMIEDVLGWLVVLIGAFVIKFTELMIIDPLLSIGVALFILGNALRNISETLSLFLEKTPRNIHVADLKDHLCQVNGVLGVHHVHVWSLDNYNHFATMHVVINGDACQIKTDLRKQLHAHGIHHATLELEADGEPCAEQDCQISAAPPSHHSCHHHHHSHKKPVL